MSKKNNKKWNWWKIMLGCLVAGIILGIAIPEEHFDYFMYGGFLGLMLGIILMKDQIKND